MTAYRSHDIIGARKNGVSAIGVLWGYGSQEELVGAGATILYKEPSELAQLVC